MSTPSKNNQLTLPLSQPDRLLRALREQDLTETQAQALVPTLLKLAEWQPPEALATPEDTRQLLQRLAPYARRLSPVRAALMQHRANPPSRLFWLLITARQQIKILQLSFWLLSALVTFLGMLFVLASSTDANQVLLLRLGGPLLAFMGALSAFRSSSQAVLEVELACPPSLLQLTLSRLVVVLGYDIGLGLLMSVVVATWGSESFLLVTLHWLMPLLLVMGIALMLSLYLSAVQAASLAYGGWLGLLGGVEVAQKFGMNSLNLNTAVELALGLAGIALLMLGLLYLKRAVPAMLPRQ